MNKTKIEWCDSTWNPVTGCRHGCEYCYARRIAERFGGYTMDGIFFTEQFFEILDEPLTIERANGKKAKAPYPFGFQPTLHRYRLGEYEKKAGRTIFVCSMADLFGEWVPDSWINEVFAACEKAPQHRYLFLTKNPQRYGELARAGKLPQRENMWYGSTVTSMEEYFSSNEMFNTFLSIEPMLASISPLTIQGVKWVVIGAETGNRKGKVMPKKEWVDKICEVADITKMAIYMKDSLAPIVGEENMRREFPWTTKKREVK